jgi:hypothetical protein
MPRDKKELGILRDARDKRRELKYLYARRSAIDAVIDSLKNYDRQRELPRRNEETLKTA